MEEHEVPQPKDNSSAAADTPADCEDDLLEIARAMNPTMKHLLIQGGQVNWHETQRHLRPPPEVELKKQPSEDEAVAKKPGPSQPTRAVADSKIQHTNTESSSLPNPGDFREYQQHQREV